MASGWGSEMMHKFLSMQGLCSCFSSKISSRNSGTWQLLWTLPGQKKCKSYMFKPRKSVLHDNVPSKEHCWLNSHTFWGAELYNLSTHLIGQTVAICKHLQSPPLCLSWGGVQKSRFRLLSGTQKCLLHFASPLLSQKAFPSLWLQSSQTAVSIPFPASLHGFTVRTFSM